MHSLRCLRIMQMRTIVALGLFSLSITFLLLVFHSQAEEHRDVPSMPPGVNDLHFARDNAFVKSHGQKQQATISKLKEKDDFVYHQDQGPLDINDEERDTASKGNFYSYSNDTRPPLTIPRLMKYCNLPHAQSQGLEGLVPKEYKLISVQVLIRHGDRSPIYKLPSGHATELSCLVDTSQYHHLPKVVSYPHVMAAAMNKSPQTNTFLRWSMYPSHTVCGEGQLTGQGAVQHIMNGMHLNERYVHQHQLISMNNWASQVLIHSTETSRTYQSALAFVYGFAPEFDITKLNLGISTSVNFCEEKVFGLACHCPWVDALRTKADGECKLNSQVQKTSKEYRNLLHYVSEVLGISPNAIPGATSLMDGLAGHTCHSVPYPCRSDGSCITSKVLEAVWKVIDAKSKCMGDNPTYAKFSRAMMHGLLFRIARNFKVSAENGTNAKFHLYSGHDTTVSPLLVALGIRDNVWPGYAHRIVFELYKKTSGSRQHFFRVLQNGKVVTEEVIFCRNRIVENGLCDFENFMQYVQERDLMAFCYSLKTSNQGAKNQEF